MDKSQPFNSSIEASGFLLSRLRVGAPRPPALPVKTIYPGDYLYAGFNQRKPMIERIIGNVMNGLEFEVEFSLVLTRPEIQHAVSAFTILIQAEPNSNMVTGEPWGKNTVYRGSKWLYIVDQVRSYLNDEGFGFITVEMQERGLRRERVDPIVMGDPCFDMPFCDWFNRGEGKVYEDVHNICTDDLRVGIHMRDLSIRDVQWVHRLPGGHFHALVMEFDGGLDEELWWPLELKIRQRLDEDDKNDLRRLPVIFSWRISVE
ncbi:hypothetical protein F4815DRAFT_443604 [Daldinia loculata]|uniref:uncharacterized protein n=1 Tax=Daldinia loculata TaxID=103429 RepID=UPI0020C44133|nr:uncharacterized protein F4817DRAFT_320423 [Daldinia loculata]KAI1642852.1 hypothetical protein F4817DRAFT_320423 [Daldinia loculata]KAI2782148.1 hypothetical protein F4815DRAFT_443604 [Daldinia loculata]